MKKIIIVGVIVFVIGVVISPMVGMAISSTRSLILGMAPDEAILTLADKIDADRTDLQQNLSDRDKQIQDLQFANSDLQSTLDDQSKQLDSQKNDMTQVKSDIQSSQTMAAKQKDCNVNIAKYCIAPQYTDPDKFKSFMNDCMDSCTKDGESKNTCEDKYCLGHYKKYFDGCQAAIECK